MGFVNRRRRVAVTGAAGSIATGFVRSVQDTYDLILIDLPGRISAAQSALGSVVETDLTNLEQMAGLLDGVDTVVHLAGERSPSATWSSLYPANIVATYNTFSAAVAAGCRRIVYASSVHAISGYPTTEQIRESDPVRPGDLYGVTKCFGEALGAYVADREGVSFVALRIGAFQLPEQLSDPGSGWMLRDFCDPNDLYQLIESVIEATDIRFEIYNAVSGNRFSRLTMAKAADQLGFVPSADAFELSPPFRSAFDAVGGLDDKPAASGLRDELGRLAAKGAVWRG